MNILGWLVLCIYFLVMLGMGFWARAKVKTASDFFTAGGTMPWWLTGISHHMSGYSSAVFVATLPSLTHRASASTSGGLAQLASHSSSAPIFFQVAGRGCAKD